MEVLEKTPKQELIEAIKEMNDDRKIQQLLFQIQPKVVLDKSKENWLTMEESKSRLKARLAEKWGK